MGLKRKRRKQLANANERISFAILCVTLMHSLVVILVYYGNMDINRFMLMVWNTSNLMQNTAAVIANFEQRNKNIIIFQRIIELSSNSTLPLRTPIQFMATNETDAACWNRFDFGMLNTWNETSEFFCAPRSYDEQASYLKSRIVGDGWLRCRVQVHPLLPSATAPHTMCDGENIVLDIRKLAPASCLPSRPNYKCGFPSIWQFYSSGALTAKCRKTKSFVPKMFPNDHLKDMFASFRAEEANVTSQYELESVIDLAPIVLVVARERGEHADMFHTTTDFLNMFATLHVAGVIDGAAAGREGLDDVQVLLLDEQRGPYEEAFIRPVFSPMHPILYVSTLKAQGMARLRLRRALFVPPAYSNILHAKPEMLDGLRAADGSHGYCTTPGGSRLLRRYRGFALGGMSVALQPAGGGPGRLRVVLQSRASFGCGFDRVGSWGPQVQVLTDLKIPD
jgi:hypothetical protein